MSRFAAFDATECDVLLGAIGDHVNLYGLELINEYRPYVLSLFNECPDPANDCIEDKVRHYCMDPSLDTAAAEAKCIAIIAAIKAL